MREPISLCLTEGPREELDRLNEDEGATKSDAVRAALRGYIFIPLLPCPPTAATDETPR